MLRMEQWRRDYDCHPTARQAGTFVGSLHVLLWLHPGPLASFQSPKNAYVVKGSQPTPDDTDEVWWQVLCNNIALSVLSVG